MAADLRQMETEPFTAERVWEAEGVPVLTARVSLPQPTDTRGRAARRIRRYYRAQGRAFLRYCDRWLVPVLAEPVRAALAASRPLPMFQAELTFHITYNEGGFWSLYTQSGEPLPEGGTLLRRRGDIWDLRTGYPVTLDRFPRPQGGWKRAVTALAGAEIQRQEAAGIARYDPGWRQKLRRQFNPMNVYLTPEGLTFFYPMFTIAPSVEGIPTFTLPWNASGKK